MNTGTKINKIALNNWGTNIYDYNDDAIDNLNSFKDDITAINNSYQGVSAEGFTSKVKADVDKAVKVHTNMQNLQTFLDKVVTSAENM